MAERKPLVLNGGQIERLQDADSIALNLPMTAEGRLTVLSANPVPSSSSPAVGQIFYVPFIGNRIALYDGTVWRMKTFSTLTLNLSGLTSGKNYDIFVYDNAGTLTLEIGAAWTSDLIRNNAIARQDGVWVKDADHTRRYLGTFRATGAAQTEDTFTQRFLWNVANKVPRWMVKTEATNSWTYTTAVWRPANNDTNNRVEYVVGLDEDLVEVNVHAHVTSTALATIGAASGVGVDQTSINAAQVTGAVMNAGAPQAAVHAMYKGQPGQGYHFLQWLEISEASGVTTWYGDQGQTFVSKGLMATLDM